MAARKRQTLNATWKQKIQATQIAHRFEKCFNGEIELSPTQLKAGQILFDKLEPNLNKTDVQPLDKEGNKSDGFKITVEHVSK